MWITKLTNLLFCSKILIYIFFEKKNLQKITYISTRKYVGNLYNTMIIVKQFWAMYLHYFGLYNYFKRLIWYYKFITILSLLLFVIIVQSKMGLCVMIQRYNNLITITDCFVNMFYNRSN